MRSFQASIEQMLWPEKRDKDPLFKNESGPGVGVIDRITVDSYLEVPETYIPPPLRRWSAGRNGSSPSSAAAERRSRVGPFPKGMPIGLITNIDIRGDELRRRNASEHRKRKC